MTTRTLTFKSSDLGENLNLVLVFTSPDVTISGPRNDTTHVPKQYPVVWKTANLHARGNSSLTATFVNAPGFCTVQYGGRKIVTPASYVPIQVGQETTLNVRNNVIPPVFYFSDPTSIAGDIIRATNVTGQTVNIGLGFIADAETTAETIVPTTVFRNVGPGFVVSDAFTPFLRAYVNIGNYTEGQLIEHDLSGFQPIWEANLLDLQPSTNIILQASAIPQPVRQVKPVQVQVQPVPTVTEVVEVRLPKVEVVAEDYQTVYSTVLAFPHAENVVQSVKHIAEQLIGKGYQVKFTYAEGSTEASLSLTLPSHGNCNQAEKDLLSVIENYLASTPLSPRLGALNGFENGSSHRHQTRISIKSRSASRLVSGGESFSYWTEINPASNEWLYGYRDGGLNGPFTFPKAYLGGILESVSSLNGKGRPLSRRSSTVGLNTVAVY